MKFEFPETILEAKFGEGRSLKLEVAEAFWAVQEMAGQANVEFTDPLQRDRAILEKLVAYCEAKDCRITLGQAEALDRAIANAYEEHKKKLPALPKSLTDTSLTQPLSTDTSISPSPTTSPVLKPATSSGSDEPSGS